MRNRIYLMALGALSALLLTAFKHIPEPVITTFDSPWLLEEDFLNDPTLHATRNQTIVLNLESSFHNKKKSHRHEKDSYEYRKHDLEDRRYSDKDEKESPRGRRDIRKNSIRFLVEEEQQFSFCIPDDEQAIVQIKMKHSSGRTVMNSRRGAACEAVMLEPGRYSMDIIHDGRRVGLTGKKAFLHRPERRRHLRSQTLADNDPTKQTLQEQLIYPNFFAMSAGSNSIGKLYPHLDTTGSFPKMSLSANAKGVLDQYVWTFYDETTDDRQFTNSRPMVPWLPQAEWNKGITPLTVTPWVNGTFELAPYTVKFHTRNCPNLFNDKITYYCAPAYILNDMGNGEYTMWADIELDTLIYPWVDAQSGSPANLIPVILSAIEGGAPDPNALVWDFTYIGYVNSKNMPKLQEGEFALYNQCDFKGTAFVFDENVDYSKFSAMTQPGIKPPGSIGSIKLGPSTFLEMFKNSQNVANVGTDVSCNTEPILTDQITVFVDVLKFIATTNSCTNCNLAGMDFSGDDFSGADFGDGTKGVDFSGAILTGANLVNTNLTNTNLTDADLDTIGGVNGSSMSGAIFTGATLGCTSFKGSDLSPATFANNSFMTDQSCNVDLSAATLDYSTFDEVDWRYLNLTSSNVSNVPDALSSAEKPLDLSGGNISYVTWLEGKTLDYINLGCYPSDPNAQTTCPGENGNKVCTTLQGTVLSKASLKYACLNQASMEGASLNFSNLDGADLSGAQLEAKTGKVATMEGAFMRNVKMSGANLTGVNATNVNFFSSSSTETAEANDLTAPGANFSEAYMEGADFSGSTANLQSTIWTGAMLINANFSQADLSINTSGGINSGTNSTFNGAYLHGANFDQANISDVDFTSTYWDAQGSGGAFNFLIPTNNLNFNGYWKDTNLPECPNPEIKYASVSPPTTPTGTDMNNTCPSGLTGPCDGYWDQPASDISEAFFKSETSGYPQVGGVAAEDQCDGANNPADFCWTVTNNPGKCPEN